MMSQCCLILKIFLDELLKPAVRIFLGSRLRYLKVVHMEIIAIEYTSVFRSEPCDLHCLAINYKYQGLLSIAARILRKL